METCPKCAGESDGRRHSFGSRQTWARILRSQSFSFLTSTTDMMSTYRLFGGSK